MTPHVEILYVAGCPHNERARALVEHVVAELRIAPTIELVAVPGAESAKELRFFGSPTIRVNGRDVEPHADRPDDFVLTCACIEDGAGPPGGRHCCGFARALAETVR